MKIELIPGKNHKTFALITDVKTKYDFELYDICKKVLSRTEYKPFLQGFNKNISDSYLFNDYIFPVQFLNDIEISLKKLGANIEIENENFRYKIPSLDRFEFDEWIKELKFPEDLKTDVDEYKFQQDSVFYGIKNGIARIEVGTSGGKTFITYLYCKYLFDKIFGETKKILIVVPNKDLAKQLITDFRYYDKYSKRPLGIETMYSGAKKVYDADIVCGTFQSLSQYDKEYFDDFGAFICDEVHRSKAYSIRNEIFNKLYNCEFFFGMTGTMPEYKTLDYLHITSMFGTKVVEKGAYELIEDGISTPVKITLIKIKYKEHNELSKNLIEQKIIGKEKFAVEKQFFHTYDKRTELAGKLLNALHENSLIIVDTVEYCQILYDYLSEYCPKWTFKIVNGFVNNRTEIFDEMRSADNHYCIIGTYGTMSTGINIKNLTNGYLLDGGKSAIRIGQTIGRLMRLFPNKKFARLFDFYDDIPGCSFKNHAKERIKYYVFKKFEYTITNVEI